MQGFPIVTNENVRYGDLDPFGHMNNTVFLRFFEQARIAYFGQIGLYGPAGRGDRNLMLAETRCKFLSEGHLDDELACGGRFTRFGNASCEMAYRLERRGGPHLKSAPLLAEGSAVLVYFNFLSGKSERLPDALRAQIRALESNAGNVVAGR